MIVSQLDQTPTSLPHFSLSILDAWKSRSWRPIFGLNGISSTSRVVWSYAKIVTVQNEFMLMWVFYSILARRSDSSPWGPQTTQQVTSWITSWLHTGMYLVLLQ